MKHMQSKCSQEESYEQQSRALSETPSQSHKVSLAIRDHSVTCHPTQVNTPRLNPSQIGW